MILFSREIMKARERFLCFKRAFGQIATPVRASIHDSRRQPCQTAGQGNLREQPPTASEYLRGVNYAPKIVRYLAESGSLSFMSDDCVDWLERRDGDE